MTSSRKRQTVPIRQAVARPTLRDPTDCGRVRNDNLLWFPSGEIGSEPPPAFRDAQVAFTEHFSQTKDAASHSRTVFAYRT